MATLKKQSHPLNSMHTAGIFSDSTIDGPEIGTLVLIVDKAKNLPNRKTIGKQDPYCAARLGKEAKKTATDVRGGQTPKWDQELRFTVHDCPDYYQLKVSVFNDDKKTDLIGETWIDLRDIILTGGGQSDTWHTLNCRSRYAGEIRLEITFYDSRPKPEKPVAKPKAIMSGPDPDAPPPLVQQAGTPKRRPLPTEPPNGPAPAVAAAPEQVQTPPRPQPNGPAQFVSSQSPLQSIEYSTPPQSSRYHQNSHHNSPASAPPTAYNTPPPHPSQKSPHPRTSERHDKYSGRPEEPDYGAAGDRSQYSSSYPQSHSQSYDHQDPRSSFDGDRDPYVQRSMPPMDPPRHASIDEDRPPPPPIHRSRGGSAAADMAYRASNFDAAQRGTPPTMRQDVLRTAHRQSVGQASYPGRPTYRPYDSAPLPANGHQYADEAAAHQPSPPRHHSFDQVYDPHPPYDSHHRSMQPTVEDDPESPTAAATTFRKSSSRAPQALLQYNEPEYDTPAPLNLSGRNSASGQYSPTPAAAPQSRGRQYSSNGYAHEISTSPGAQRGSAYAVNGDPSYPRDGYTRDRHQRTPSPNPMVDHQISPGASQFKDHHAGSQVYSGGGSSRDHYQTSPAPSPHSSRHNIPSQRQIEYRSETEDHYTQRSPGAPVVPPNVPASLVPGVDPNLALELSSRMKEDRRHETRRASEITMPTRGRQMIEYGHDNSTQHYSTSPQHMSYEHGNPPGYSSGRAPSPAPPHPVSHRRSMSPLPGQHTVSHRRSVSPLPAQQRAVTHRRSTSPMPGAPQQQHTIRRKSVSPSPLMEPQRRLSGVPFAPDSFDELNPHVSAGAVTDRHKERPDFNEASGKIIGHDGREIDPSDHLPMDTWAPEPEPREPKPPAQNPRASDSALPIGTSGRRQLRIAAVKPQSSLVTYGNGSSSTSALPGYGGDTSPSAGRSRLQKKVVQARGSGAALSSSPGGGSPLAPLQQPYHQDNYAPPRSMRRASTYDFHQSENHAPLVLYNGGGGNRGGYSSNAPPPIPAKIPISGGGGGYSSSGYRGGADHGMPMMSGALPPPDGSYGGNGGDWALMEEMKRIDLGSGRARRHGGGY